MANASKTLIDALDAAYTKSGNNPAPAQDIPVPADVIKQLADHLTAAATIVAKLTTQEK